MNDRRRFLHVLGATTAAVALPACGGSETASGPGSTGAGGAGGGSATTGGVGGAGGGDGTGGSNAAGTTAGSTGSATASSSTGGGCEMNPTGTLVGAPTDFGDEGLHLVPNTKVIVGRDAGGLYALTSVCPHEFCDMDGKTQGQPTGTVSAQGVTCNCHGSKFDNYGKVLKGPANKPLKAYAMVLACDGKIYVDKTTVVPIEQRLDA
jgi:nitrite reductase/ring-hydroxylating ferredoxin subunit